MKSNATLIVTLFFNPHELTKIVLISSTKYSTKLHHLPYRTEPKRFFLFSRVANHTGRDQRVTAFNFCRHCETFIRKNFIPQRVPPFQFFCCFATEWMLKSSKGSSSQFFWHCEIYFRKKSLFNFLLFCDRMDVEKFKRVLLSVFSAL